MLGWILAMVVTTVLHASPTGQYVEMTVELQADQWGYWFLSDPIKDGGHKVRSIFDPTSRIRCVIGTDSYLMERRAADTSFTYWFTETNLITLRQGIKNDKPDAGEAYSYYEDSTDGNPGRTVRVADLMTFDPPSRFIWLALASGPCLKKSGEKLYPPVDFWKEYFAPMWTVTTNLFPDNLGLPRSIDFIENTNQYIFRYQTRETTNFLGWTFPLEFYGVQYIRGNIGGAVISMAFKGRVASFHPASKPSIPESVLKSSHQFKN